MNPRDGLSLEARGDPFRETGSRLRHGRGRADADSRQDRVDTIVDAAAVTTKAAERCAADASKAITWKGGPPTERRMTLTEHDQRPDND
jgi:hypothetical protein